MKAVYPLYSLVFFFGCLLSPLLIISALNGTVGVHGEWLLLLWMVFPACGILFSCLGKSGWMKVTGVLLHSGLLCLGLLVIVTRTDLWQVRP